MDSLVEALKNPGWQFVITVGLTLVVGLAGIFIPWLLVRSKKELSYRVLTNTKVVNVREEYQGRVEIRFRGHRVKNVRLLIFELINSGHKAIVPDDYIEPVTLHFSGASRILSATVIDARPRDIKHSFAEVVANAGGGEITFPPALLNSRDRVRINILVSDYQDPLTVSGRIVDVPEIKVSKDYSSSLRMVVASCIFICGMLFSSLISPPFRYVYIAAASLLVAVIYTEIVKEHRRIRDG